MELLLSSSLYPPIEHPKSSGHYVLYLTKRMFLDYISLKVCDIQRELDMEWVQTLKTKMHTMYSYNKLYDFGLFHVAHFEGNLYILDGQHRYMVLKDLIDDNVEVQMKLYTFKQKRDMDAQFQMINGGKHFQSFESVSDQILVNSFRQHMATNYKRYISAAKHPRCPNINLDMIVNKMIEMNFIETMGFQNAAELIKHIEDINDFYRYTPIETLSKWHIKNAVTAVKKCKDKSPNCPLVLGIYDHLEWIEVMMRCKTENLPYSEVSHYPSNYRERISKQMRMRVWSKRNINRTMDGNCFCCKIAITYDDFDCGHIKPVFYGGATDVDNMEPICRVCNRDMSTENMMEYIQKNFKAF